MANGPFYKVGRYACKVTDQALGETSTGKPQFVLRFKVMGLVDPADPSQFIPAAAQYERSHYRTITDKSIRYFTEDLLALGFHGESFRQLDPNTEGSHDFRGLEIDMWCAHENDQQGQLREKWSVARVGGATFDVKSLGSRQARELDHLYGKHLKGLGVTNGTARPVPAQPGPANDLGITEDDIPF